MCLRGMFFVRVLDVRRMIWSFLVWVCVLKDLMNVLVGRFV